VDRGPLPAAGCTAGCADPAVAPVRRPLGLAEMTWPTTGRPPLSCPASRSAPVISVPAAATPAMTQRVLFFTGRRAPRGAGL